MKGVRDVRKTGVPPNGGAAAAAAAAAGAGSGGEVQFPRTGLRGSPQCFARKLFALLSAESEDVIRWTESGAAFVIVDMSRFVSEVLQRWYAHGKFSSFQRQLNLYGFRKLVRGPDTGAYSHVSFRQGREDLLAEIRRTPQTNSRRERQRAQKRQAKAAAKAAAEAAKQAAAQRRGTQRQQQQQQQQEQQLQSQRQPQQQFGGAPPLLTAKEDDVDGLLDMFSTDVPIVSETDTTTSVSSSTVTVLEEEEEDQHQQQQQQQSATGAGGFSSLLSLFFGGAATTPAPASAASTAASTMMAPPTVRRMEQRGAVPAPPSYDEVLKDYHSTSAPREENVAAPMQQQQRLQHGGDQAAEYPKHDFSIDIVSELATFPHYETTQQQTQADGTVLVEAEPVFTAAGGTIDSKDYVAEPTDVFKGFNKGFEEAPQAPSASSSSRHRSPPRNRMLAKSLMTGTTLEGMLVEDGMSGLLQSLEGLDIGGHGRAGVGGGPEKPSLLRAPTVPDMLPSTSPPRSRPMSSTSSNVAKPGLGRVLSTSSDKWSDLSEDLSIDFDAVFQEDPTPASGAAPVVPPVVGPPTVPSSGTAMMMQSAGAAHMVTHRSWARAAETAESTA